MPDIDFFSFFRIALGWLVTVYATLLTAQSLWGWYVYLAGHDRYIGIVRQYIIVQGLRLRFRAFWGDVLICLLLCVVFLMLWRAHHVLYDLGETLSSLRT